MKIYPSQLHKTLAQHKTPHIFLLYGDEPVVLTDLIKQIRLTNAKEGYQQRSRCDIDEHFDGTMLTQQLHTRSLFSDKEHIEIYLQKASLDPTQANHLINALAISSDHKRILMIAPHQLDRKQQTSKWFRHIDQQGIIIQAATPPPYTMPTWLNHYVQHQQLSLTPAAKRLLLQQCEGDLLAIQQSVQCLHLLHHPNTVTENHVKALPRYQTRFDCFQLLQAIAQAEPDRIMCILEQLQQQNTPFLIVLHWIAYQIRQLWHIQILPPEKRTKQALLALQIWPSRQHMLIRASQRLSSIQLDQALTHLQQLDQHYKSQASVKLWTHLTHICLNLSGIPNLLEMGFAPCHVSK